MTPASYHPSENPLSNDSSHPPAAPSRPPIGRGPGSMRAGTQTLIQALSAVPWEEDPSSSSSSSGAESTPSEAGRPASTRPPRSSKSKRAATAANKARSQRPRMIDRTHSNESSDDDDHPQLGGSAPPLAHRSASDQSQTHEPSSSRATSLPLDTQMRQGDQLSSLPSGPDRAVSHADAALYSTGHPRHPQSGDGDLYFPFKENAVARKAKPPGTVENRYEHFVERSRSPHPQGELNERPSSPLSTAVHDEHPQRQGSDETVLATNSEGTLASDLSSVTHQVTPSVLPFKEEAKMSDQTLLNTVARNPKAGRVTGGLSGQMEDVHHAPATQADKALESERVASIERADKQEREEIGQEHEELSRRVSQSSVVQRATESRPLSPANSYARPTSSLGSSARRERETQVERWKRKAKLAEKLRAVFGLEEVEQVVHEMGCWLLRSVLLQGHMYVTNGHILFYAHMPDKRENKVLKNGPLTKKSKRHLRGSKFWFVLKNGVLAWYISSADPYFPHGNVDLASAISCEPHPRDERTFRLVSEHKKYSFQADTPQSRDEWVKAIQKAMFRVQHEGENVKIAIPFETVADVEKSPTMDFAESIEIKVVEGGDDTDTGSPGHRQRRRPQGTATFDSYFFACFHDIDWALASIKQVVDSFHGPDLPTSPVVGEGVQDTTLISERKRRRSQEWMQEKERQMRDGGVVSTLKSHILHPFASPNDHPAPPSDIKPKRRSEDELHPITHTLSAKDAAALDGGGPSLGEQLMSLRMTGDRASDRTVLGDSDEAVLTDGSHTYPPPSSSTLDDALSPSSGSSGTQWLKEKIPSILNPLRSRTSTPKPASSPPSERRSPRRVVREVVERNSTSMSPSVSRNERMDSSEAWDSEDGATTTASESGADTEHGGYSMMEKSATGEKADRAAEKSFHETFAMEKNEKLLEHFPGYLFRVIPVAGTVFVSSNHFCFRSSQVFTKTRMVIPIDDIISLQPQKAFRFGHHGLAIIIKGHEELFMEFSSAERRDACKSLLDKQAEVLKRHKRDPQPIDPDRKEAKILHDLDASGSSSAKEMHSELQASRSPAGQDASLPPVMFTSASSSFLDFKPKEPLHITCLTIGSRGDVQPYIALAKGLQAEGHTVRIASHGEYKEWIEGHGIEFGYVGGDPAELMRICVENGMFTVSFIKEGLQKFRDWIDDLLVTSWTACQGTDLIIESPSAMGGLHIAEGLAVPYFRAFTMPWTRTRAYPHAFAVPESHRGGSYNFMTYTMFDQVFWRAISGQVNSWRKKTIGIPSTTLDKMEQHKVPFLYNFSPTVVPPPLDWYEWIRVSGYWFLDNADDSTSKKWEPPAGMLDFIQKAHDDSKKVVYIGFGSIVVSDPDAMTECVVQSVLDSGVRAIVSKGWSDRLSVKKDKPKEQQEEEAKEEEKKKTEEANSYPPEIFSVSSVPHDWLFQRIDAACHHGGAGTTGASLRAGIPTIIKPFFGDQFFWADRVEVLGVGSCVRKLTKDHLTEALKTATQDIKQIDKAKLLGEEIRAENGVNNAVQSIYRDLEYARSLVKYTEHVSPDSPSPTGSPSVPMRELPASRESAQAKLSSSTSSAHGDGGESDESWDVVADDGQAKGGDRGKTKHTGLGMVGTVLGGLGSGISNGLGSKVKERKR